MNIESLIKKPVQIDSRHIYNFQPDSETAKYFHGFTEQWHKQPEKPDLYLSKKEIYATDSKAGKIMTQIVDWLKEQVPEDAIVIEIGGGSAGQKRSGMAFKKFKNYYPLDISYSHIESYTTTYNRKGFVCDAQELPFKDNSIDAIFTQTFLEHPLEPEMVLEEIVRVLKPGGIILHNDAWFVRWWHRFGVYGLKSWKTMSSKEKLIHLGASITEIKVLRIPPIIIRRLVIYFFRGGKNIPLSYRKLQPNYTLNLGCDEDAASSIDPIDVIQFYESRGFKTVQPLTLLQRLFYPNRYIVLKKIV